MYNRAIKAIVLGSCLFLFSVVSAEGAKDTPNRIKVMQEEMTRNFKVLQNEPVPPYYMSYSIDDIRSQSVSVSFGALWARSESMVSYLRVDVRTGDYNLDSSHEIRGSSISSSRSRSGANAMAPISESPDALKIILWRETDKAYKNAVESLASVKSQQSVMVAEEDKSDDFSRIKPKVAFEDPVGTSVDLDKWEARLKKYTKGFKKYPFIRTSDATFSNEVRQKYFVNTEGSRISFPAVYMKLMVRAVTKIEDGMEMPIYFGYFGFKESDFPSEKQIMADVESLVNTLKKLNTAPLVEPYTGPAILSGKASGVFFHEILGHRLEGHRQKSVAEGQTFKKQVGNQILPEFISVIFDPTVKELHGLKLSGYYPFDDEGTKAEKVVSIDKGILKNFLMSRSPIENFPSSNGHGRGQPGASPVSRQSNLIVKSKNMLSEEKLREKLIEECKKQGKDFGLFFTDISGGYTSTGRTRPNAFNVTPLAVYKVFVDGRPDELVRGVDIIGTPLTTFGKIIATGSKIEVFNGMCGAESGSVPVSALSPSILVSEIEVQKKEKSQEKPPILPSPALR